MLLASCDLGHLDLVSSSSSLQLQLSSLAAFDPPAEGSVDLDSSQIGHQTNIRPTWIYRGQRYRLVLCVRIEDGIQLADRRDMMEAISSTLKCAKLWKQLELSPSPMEMSLHEGARLATITISLSHSQDLEISTRRALHKLGVDVPCYDVSPPDGVGSVGLDAVHLALSISRLKPCKKRKLDPENGCVNSQVPKAQDFHGNGLRATPEDEILDLDIVEENLEAHRSCNDSGMGLCMTEEQSTLYPEMLLEAAHHDSSFAPSLSEKAPATTAKRSQDVLEDECMQGEGNVGPISDGEVLQLVDAGVRLAITDITAGKHGQLPKAIEISSKISFRHLADIAPALWSPKYLNNVASRVVFLPTIAHALSGSVFANARSAGLKRRLEEIARQELHPLAATDDANQRRPSIAAASKGVHSAANIRLWHLVQRAMYNTRAARTLAPLKDQDCDSTHGLAHEEMLEDVHWSDLESEVHTSDTDEGPLDGCYDDEFEDEDDLTKELFESQSLWDYDEDDDAPFDVLHDEDFAHSDIFDTDDLSNMETNSIWPEVMGRAGTENGIPSGAFGNAEELLSIASRDSERVSITSERDVDDPSGGKSDFGLVASESFDFQEILAI